MNTRKYHWLLNTIIVTIAITIGVQVYWNYKNYQQNKKYFTNQVQLSLDNALNTYYAELAESNHMTIIETDTIKIRNSHLINDADSIYLNIEKEIKRVSGKSISGFTQLTDSNSGFSYKNNGPHYSEVRVIKGKKALDSIKLLRDITSIVISIKNDTLDLQEVNSIVQSELDRKQIDITFGLYHYRNDSIYNQFNSEEIEPNFLKTFATSTFLKHNERLEILYPNATAIILKYSMSSILISTLLVIAVVASLLYLLKIIQSQKQLAEVKNDLISNITHEFKTPIATIAAALEGISDFNVINDKDKTKQYLNMSSDQLKKLNSMVEKLLETASLDSEALQFSFENVQVASILNGLLDRYKTQYASKIFQIDMDNRETTIQADPFHLENSFNNILDNAIKYGGNEISISLRKLKGKLEIKISDNGGNLKKADKNQIFEKFYRVPKGNTHDIKGYGIGLFYTKTVINKHGGDIDVELENKLTTFKITLPNG